MARTLFYNLPAGQPMYREPEPEESKAPERIEKATVGAVNLTQHVDKARETKLLRSGLLSGETYQYVDKIPGSSTEKQLLNMFERKPIVSSGDSIFSDIVDFYKQSGIPAYERIKPTSKAVEQFGAQGIGDILEGQGFSESDIDSILGSDNKWLSLQDRDALSKLDYSEDIEATIKGLDEGKTWYRPLEQSGPTDLETSLQQLDIDMTDSFVKGAKDEHTFAIAESLDELSKISPGGIEATLTSGAVYDKAIGPVFQTATETQALESFGGAVSTGGGFDMPFAEEAVSLTGKGLGKVGSVLKAAKPGLQLAGQALGAVKAGKGIYDIASGEDVGQGIEDIIQGGIGVATPWLIAAGPVGWTVLGASMLEDLFFD